MGQEIERKFLVRGDGWREEGGTATAIVQAYVATSGRASVRVRIRDDRSALLAIKSRGAGLVRAEYEYPIPLADARALLDLRTGALIEKTRFAIPRDGLVWEIDVFGGVHAGLVLAEVELDDPAQEIVLPPWIGREVTGDERYSNAALALASRPPDQDAAGER